MITITCSVNDKKIDVLPLKEQFANISLRSIVYSTDDTAKIDVQNVKNFTRDCNKGRKAYAS